MCEGLKGVVCEVCEDLRECVRVLRGDLWCAPIGIAISKRSSALSHHHPPPSE